MTQAFRSPFDGSDTLFQVTATDLPETLETLATLFSGASAPGTTFPCQLWADTDDQVLRQRNPGNSAFHDLLRMRDKAVKAVHCGQLGTISTAADRFLLVADDARTILRLALVTQGSTTSSSGNEVLLDLYNVTQAQSLFSGTVGTDTSLAGVGGGTDFAADTPFILTPDQNQDVAAGDVLELRITTTGSPTVDLQSLFAQVEGF